MLTGLRILVVEDDPVVRTLYVFVLQQAGAAVLSSGRAEEAVELIELQAPDVVVTDLQLPERDGVWLLSEMKRRLPGVPVIAVSGRVDTADVVNLQQFGFAEVLRKPVGLSEFIKLVARVAVVDRLG